MLRKNIISILIPCGLGAGLSLLINRYCPVPTDHWLYSLLWFAVLCVVFNLIYARTDPKNLSQALLAGIVIRLLLALCIVFLYSLKFRASFLTFSLHFISHYILFTIFEIRYLLHLIKTPSNNSSNT
jgi:hypothetical protein